MHAAGQQGIVAEAHTDRGLLTVVWESSPGLEVGYPRVYMPSVGVSAKISLMQGGPMHLYRCMLLQLVLSLQQLLHVSARAL